MVDNRPVERNQKTKFVGHAIFDLSHLIKDITADEDTYLVFEIQGNPDTEKISW